MKRKAVMISAFLAASLMLTGCSWNDIKAKFTGEDTSAPVASGSAIVIEDYKPEECVTVPEYKGIEVDCKISDEDIQAEIDSFLANNSTEDKIKKGKCKKGDMVNIDYVGKVDGEAFDNGSATDQTITLGSSGYIDGFDDGVVGMKVGETKDINVTFPEDYGKDGQDEEMKKLAGKPAVFTITLNYISETKMPQLNDKLVSEKTEYKTVAEYKDGTRKKLVDDKKKNAGQTAYGEVEQKAEVKKYPETLVESCKSQLDAYYKYTAKQYGYSDFKTFLSAMQMDEATYNDNLLKAAQSISKTQLLAEAIAAKENITVTDEEIKAEIANVAKQAEQEEAELKKNFEDLYGQAITIERYYKVTLLTNKVIDFVGENAKIIE